MTTGKTIALTRQTFVDKVMSLLFNMLSRLVITFFPRSKHLLTSLLQSPCAVILEPKKNKVWHCFPIYFPWSDGTRCHDLRFSECWVLSQLFPSPLSPSSRGFLVPLHFLQVQTVAGSATLKCDFGQVRQPLCAGFSWLLFVDNISTFLIELLKDKMR